MAGPPDTGLTSSRSIGPDEDAWCKMAIFTPDEHDGYVLETVEGHLNEFDVYSSNEGLAWGFIRKTTRQLEHVVLDPDRGGHGLPPCPCGEASPCLGQVAIVMHRYINCRVKTQRRSS